MLLFLISFILTDLKEEEEEEEEEEATSIFSRFISLFSLWTEPRWPVY